MTFENLAPKCPSEDGSMSLSPLSPASPRKVCSLWHIFFVLLAMNGPLPAELKFRENTVPGAPNSGSLILKVMSFLL